MKGRNFPVKGGNCVIKALSVSPERNPTARAPRNKLILWLIQLWSRDQKWKPPPTPSLLHPSLLLYLPSLFPPPTTLFHLSGLAPQAGCLLRQLKIVSTSCSLTSHPCNSGTPKEEWYSLASQHYGQCSKTVLIGPVEVTCPSSPVCASRDAGF